LGAFAGVEPDELDAGADVFVELLDELVAAPAMVAPPIAAPTIAATTIMNLAVRLGRLRVGGSGATSGAGGYMASLLRYGMGVHSLFERSASIGAEPESHRRVK
jgi:hypothetical protein